MGTAEVLARLMRNEEFARAWALEEPRIALAVNVSRLRLDRGLTQQQLAEAAGMRQPRVAELERGDGNPRLETLIRIANALGVDVAVLLDRNRSEEGEASEESHRIIG
jgi:transcriptional regulator with XRE-family HTH domain